MKRPKGFIPHDSEELLKRLQEAKIVEQELTQDQAAMQKISDDETQEHSFESEPFEAESFEVESLETDPVGSESDSSRSDSSELQAAKPSKHKLSLFKRPTYKKELEEHEDRLTDSDRLALKEAHQEVISAKKEVRQAKRLRKRRERQEKRRFTAYSRSRWIKLYILAGSILGLATFVAVGAFTPIMAIKNIEVHGADRIDAEELSIALQPFKGEPIALIDQSEIVNVLENFTQIEQFSTHLIPPDTLSVVIVERDAVLAVKDGKGYNLVDAAGIVLEKVSSKKKPKNVPIVSGEGAQIGSDEFFAAAQVSQRLPSSFRKQIKRVKAPTAFSVTISLKSGIEVLWGDSAETAYKLLVLESILEALEDETIKKIDVSSPKSPVFE